MQFNQQMRESNWYKICKEEGIKGYKKILDNYYKSIWKKNEVKLKRN